MVEIVRLYLPIKTVSEANQHEHWRNRQRRAKKHRTDAGYLILSAGLPKLKSPIVELIRIAPRDMDQDNLVGSFKHVQDGIADGLGLANDRDGINWLYSQRRGKPKEYAVEVVIYQN